MLRLKCVWVYPRIRRTGEALGCKPSSLVDRNPAATIWLMLVRIYLDCLTHNQLRSHEEKNVISIWSIGPLQCNNGSGRFSLIQMRFYAQPTCKQSHVRKRKLQRFWKAPLIITTVWLPCHRKCRHWMLNPSKYSKSTLSKTNSRFELFLTCALQRDKPLDSHLISHVTFSCTVYIAPSVDSKFLSFCLSTSQHDQETESDSPE